MIDSQAQVQEHMKDVEKLCKYVQIRTSMHIYTILCKCLTNHAHVSTSMHKYANIGKCIFKYAKKIYIH